MSPRAGKPIAPAFAQGPRGITGRADPVDMRYHPAVIIVGTCVGGDGSKYRQVALPHIQGALEPADMVLARSGEVGIAQVYNYFIRKARDRPDCEALVLVHDDVEILDRNFRAKIIAAADEANVGVIGVVGGSELTSVEWYNARRKVGRVHETRFSIDFGASRGDVDVVDGLLMAITPRAFRVLDFDEVACHAYHGYDLDYCLSARSAGFRVTVAPLDIMHRTKGGYGDAEAFSLTAAALNLKWSAYIRPLSRAERARTRVANAHRLASTATRRARRYTSALHHLMSGVGPHTPVERAPTTPKSPPTCPVCGTALSSPEMSLTIIECPDCGTGVTWPPPTTDVRGTELWTEMYGETRLSRRSTWLNEARLRLDWMLLYQAGGCLLEVGCGTGEFVHIAETAGFDAYGVEPSEWAAIHARELGVRVEIGFLSDWIKQFPGLRPDVIAAWHVLEHIPEPMTFLSEVWSVLPPTGLLLIEVPNFASPAAAELGLAWEGAQPSQHYFHYTSESLSRLLTASGFQVEHKAAFSGRLYVSAADWRRQRNAALVAGRSWPPLDFLRIVAVKRPLRDCTRLPV